MKRFGFTLIEVNLAMFVMALGTLGLVGLYAFGYRENQQSNEDVRAAAVAEATMNAMIAALSSTNMTWSNWMSLRGAGDIGCRPEKGWGEYANDGTTAGGVVSNDGTENYTPVSDPSSIARTQVFAPVMNAAGKSMNFDDEGMAVGMVLVPVYAPGDNTRQHPRAYSIAVRCGQRPATLLYQPLYFAEVAFQGLKE